MAVFSSPLKDDAYVLQLSSDHSKLLAITNCSFGNDCSLWSLPLPTGSPRRLGTCGWELARWSPDGNWLVYGQGRELWLAAQDGSNPKKIVSIPKGRIEWVAFSPESGRIRFTIEDGDANTSAIWEARRDGSNLHPILPGWHSSPHECCGYWPPDGRYYIFRSTFTSELTPFMGAGDIFALADSASFLHRSSATPTQLTFGPTRYQIGGFTPDGKKLLVTASEHRPELVRYDPASKTFTPYLGGTAIAFVSFSHDGKYIAYVRVNDGTLWTSRADGSEQLQLTYPPDRAVLPRWSPDGTQIVFMQAQTGKPWKAVLVSSQGGNPQEVLPGPTTEGDPNWSPDGKRIVFSTGLPSGNSSQSDLRIMDLQTHQVLPVPDSTAMFSPRWSPDGRYLAALDLTANSKKLFLFDFQTQKWSEWMTDPDGVAYIAWAPDSRSVRYDSGLAYKEVKLGSSRPEPLFSTEKLNIYLTELGPWADNTPDGSRMYLRDTTSRDIYALDLDLP